MRLRHCPRAQMIRSQDNAVSLYDAGISRNTLPSTYRRLRYPKACYLDCGLRACSVRRDYCHDYALWRFGGGMVGAPRPLTSLRVPSRWAVEQLKAFGTGKGDPCLSVSRIIGQTCLTATALGRLLAWAAVIGQTVRFQPLVKPSSRSVPLGDISKHGPTPLHARQAVPIM